MGWHRSQQREGRTSTSKSAAARRAPQHRKSRLACNVNRALFLWPIQRTSYHPLPRHPKHYIHMTSKMRIEFRHDRWPCLKSMRKV